MDKLVIKPFLITGLPRSRTAWMSVAANLAPRVVCYHEPLAGLSRWEDIFEKVWRDHGPNIEFVGISDHALGFHVPEILAWRDDVRVLIIDRAIADVNASLTKLGLPYPQYCDVLNRRLWSANHKNIRRIRFANLDHPQDVLSSLSWVLPGARLDYMKLLRITHLNIQADLAATCDAAMRLAPARATALLGQDVVRELNKLRQICKS